MMRRDAKAFAASGIVGRQLKAAFTGGGAWHMSRNGSVRNALSNAVLRRYGFFVPSDLLNAAEFNRRMRKKPHVRWCGKVTGPHNPGHST